MQNLKTRWNDPGGYREVLVIAIPLILSTATWSIQHFVDRMFLTWYSPEAIAAAMPAGSTFKATERPMEFSHASYTTPMPPLPITVRIL